MRSSRYLGGAIARGRGTGPFSARGRSPGCRVAIEGLKKRLLSTPRKRSTRSSFSTTVPHKPPLARISRSPWESGVTRDGGAAAARLRAKGAAEAGRTPFWTTRPIALAGVALSEATAKRGLVLLASTLALAVRRVGSHSRSCACGRSAPGRRAPAPARRPRRGLRTGSSWSPAKPESARSTICVLGQRARRPSSTATRRRQSSPCHRRIRFHRPPANAENPYCVG